jgi:hypothetical protein
MAHPTPSRRNPLAGIATLPATPAAPARQCDDAALIAACARYVELLDREDAIFEGGPVRPSSPRYAELLRLEAERDTCMVRIEELSTRTLAGFAARARVVERITREEDGWLRVLLPSEIHANRHLGALLRDLLAAA